MISRTTHPNYDRQDLVDEALRKTQEQDPPQALLHDLDQLCGEDGCWCGGPALWPAPPR